MKKILTVLLVLHFAILINAQDSVVTKPDFSGIWVLDKKKSGAQGAAFGSEIFVDIKLVIDHKDPEMNIIQTITPDNGVEKTQNIAIFTDGRRKPWNGKNDADNYLMYSWEGNSLIKTAKFVIGRSEGWDWFLDKHKKNSLKMENKEEWKLSKDGKTLTQKTTGGTAPGVPSPSPFIYVFRRQT